MSPTYSFICDNADCETHEVEHFCSMKDKPDILDCPECGRQCQSSISAPHFRIYGASFANGYAGPSNYVTLDKLKKAKKDKH